MSFYSQEEREIAKNRTDLEGIKGRTLKLNMDNEEDRLLHIYLEDKSFTDVVKQALKIYKRQFDPEILQERELQRIEAMRNVHVEIPEVKVTQEFKTPQNVITDELEDTTEPTVSKKAANLTETNLEDF